MKVTLITGFLGAGKTTFLNRFIREYSGEEKLGVIVNDLSELEVDGELLRGGHRVSEEKGTLISLFNGSISSGKRMEFFEALAKMKERGIVRVMIEASGSTHPDAVIEAIRGLGGMKLGAVVALVDARMICHDYDEGSSLIDALRSDDRLTEHLLADQVKAANVVVVTKIDLIPEASLRPVFQTLMMINRSATFIACAYGKIDWRILEMGNFPERIQEQEISIRSLPEIVSRVIRDPRPLHPGRFYEVYRSRLGMGVYRSKGFIWFASRPDQVLLWNQAGGAMGLELLAFWKAHLLQTDVRLLPEEREHLKRQLAEGHPIFGDRNCELTLIGLERDIGIFEKELAGCFCTEAEIERWQDGGNFDDPWPKQISKI